MVVMVMILFTCGELVLVLWEVGPILWNGYGISGQNDVALLKGSGMSAGLHFTNLILDTNCCSITASILDQRLNMLNKRNSSQRTKVFSRQGMVHMTALLKTVDGVERRPNFVNFEESRKNGETAGWKSFTVRCGETPFEVGGGGSCKNSEGLLMCDDLIEIVECIWVNIWCLLHWIWSQNCRSILPLRAWRPTCE